MVMNDTITRRGLVVAAGAAALLRASAPASRRAGHRIGAGADRHGHWRREQGHQFEGKPEQAMYKDFEGIFARYADVPAIARSALGPAARRANAGDEMSAFTKAYQGYIGTRPTPLPRVHRGADRGESERQARRKSYYGDLGCTSAG